MGPFETMRRFAATAALLALAAAGPPPPPSPPDVLVVGAGISGLSAALEAARGGARVLVVDMWSVFGGHAVMSQGGLCIVGTPTQRERGIEDTPELAERDFLAWGDDPDVEWVRYYVRHSREQIYDWLTEMGVGFDDVSQPRGNSVPRFHQTRGRGLGLVSPIYRECVRHPNVSFRWSFRVDELVERDGRVVGVRGVDRRTGTRDELLARRVVLATGGFQSNLEMVRAFWPKTLPFPERLLAGSGVNSVGSGHRLARAVGAAYHRMDHQWNYATGLPDPRYPDGRALNASNRDAIWVNAEGRRFVNERAGTKVTFPAVVRQRPASYWAVFDEKAKRHFFVSGSDWGSFEKIDRLLFQNPDLVRTAGTIEELARKAGLDPAALRATVDRYNAMVDRSFDEDFGRFDETTTPRPARIDTPPFYAVRFYPMTRKSMGGVAIDRRCRVLDAEGRPIPGLFAVGEVAGFGGINGSAGLEGTFLGPSIVTGRVAGRSVLEELAAEGAPTSALPPPSPAEGTAAAVRRPTPSEDEACRSCHDLASLVREGRTGYEHFESAHRVVLERAHSCGDCHAELFPYDSERHRIDRLAQIETCRFCHVAEEEEP